VESSSHNNVQKRIILAAVALIILALLGAAYMLRPRGRAAIKVATLQGGISTLDLVEKLDLGEQFGIDVQVIRLQKTPDIAVALAKGEVDAAIVPAEVAARMIEEGAPVKIAAVDMLQNQAILTMNDTIKTPADLKGRRVAAVTASGTYKMFKAYLLLLYHLRVGEQGAPGDVAVVNAPPGSLVDALRRGDVDAIVAWEPLVSMALVKGARIVADYQQMWRAAKLQGPPVMLVWVVRSDVPSDTVNALIKARNEAAEIWVKNPAATKKIITEIYRLPPQVFDTMYHRTIIYTGPLNNTAIQGIRSEWWLAWKGGYLPRSPDAIPDTVFLKP